MRIFRNLRQALRGLVLNKANTFLMTLGIIIGIASLTVIVAIGEGTKSRVLDRMSDMGFGPDSFSVVAGAGRLFFARPGETTSMTLEDADDIRALPAVGIVIPGQRKDVRFIYKKNFTSARLEAVTPIWQTARNWALSDGAFFTDRDMEQKRRVIVLGSTPAKKLFVDENPIGKTIRVDQTLFQVIGILEEKGLNESGWDPDNRSLIPLTTSISRLTHQTYLHSIRVTTLHPSLVPQTMENIRQILRENHNLSPLAEDDFRYITPEGIMQRVTESSQALNRMLFLISTISLLVGGIVIMNILLVSIRERIHEIGIRRCFGARRSDIVQQFLFESVFIAILGGILGAGFGLGICRGMQQFNILSTKITWEPFVLAFLFSLLIGLVFGIHPARKAALLSPEESLR